MYTAPGRFAQAGAHYRTLDLNARVEAASPHGLVSILFDELGRALSLTKAGIRQNDAARRTQGRGRAMAILQSLSASLDHERGGPVADSLSSVYREATRLVALGTRDADADAIEGAKLMVAEVAGAWNAVGGTDAA